MNASKKDHPFFLQDAEVRPGSTGGLRVHPRVPLRVTVKIGNEAHGALEIGLGGFSSRQFATLTESAGTIEAELVLPFDDATVAVALHVHVRRVWQNDNGEQGFEFVSLTRQQGRVLHRLIEDCLAKQVSVVDNLLPRSGAGAPRAAAAVPRRAWRLSGLAVLLGSTVALLLLFAAAPIFSVSSKVAAVAIRGALARAPAAGILVGRALAVGQAVAPGELLFSVRTPDGVNRSAVALGEQQRASFALREQQVERREVDALAGHLVQVARAKVAAIRSKLDSTDAQIATAAALLARMEDPAHKDYVPALQVDTQRIALEALRKSREDARTELAAAESEVALAGSGSLRTDRSTSGQTRDVMGVRVGAANAAFSAADRNLAAVTEATEVRSPCDCIVHSVMATPGDVVAAGALVYTLRPRGGAAVVDAMVAADRAHELRPGAFAMIALPGRWIGGRLDHVSYLEADAARLGLPPGAAASAADRGDSSATAVVVPDTPIDPGLIGTPARVFVTSNPLLAALARVFALFH